MSNDFLETLRADMAVMEIKKTGFLSIAWCCFARSDFLAVFLYRLASAWVEKGRMGRGLALVFWRLNVFLNGCDISPKAKIGEGFSMPHPCGIVIGPCVIGRNVQIYQNVSMGRKKRSDNYEGMFSRPQVGDNVVIYAGAVVAGGCVIGDGAQIGANSLVLEDVPPDCIAVGVPAIVRTLPAVKLKSVS